MDRRGWVGYLGYVVFVIERFNWIWNFSVIMVGISGIIDFGSLVFNGEYGR